MCYTACVRMLWIGSQSRKQSFQAQSLASVGIELAISLLVGVWFGKKIDGWVGTENIFQLIGLLMGLVAGFRSVIVLALRHRSQTSVKAEK